MIEYALTYGRPRIGNSSGEVIYERRILRRGFGADEQAENWAREVLPYELGLTHRGRQHLAVPMRCERPVRGRRMVIWEAASKSDQPRAF